MLNTSSHCFIASSLHCFWCPALLLWHHTNFLHMYTVHTVNLYITATRALTYKNISAISDIWNSTLYSDIWENFVGLEVAYPISEKTRYRYFNLFRYWNKHDLHAYIYLDLFWWTKSLTHIHLITLSPYILIHFLSLTLTFTLLIIHSITQLGTHSDSLTHSHSLAN